MGTQHPRYRLLIEALPSEVPVVVRLRCVLKRLLRTFGFRCVEVLEVPAGDDTALAVEEDSGR